MSSELWCPRSFLKIVFRALLRISQLLHLFCCLFCHVPWASEGVTQMSHLGLSTHQSLLSALWAVMSPCVNCCPQQKEASLSKTETSWNLNQQTQTSRGRLDHTAMWQTSRGRFPSMSMSSPAMGFDKIYSVCQACFPPTGSQTPFLPAFADPCLPLKVYFKFSFREFQIWVLCLHHASIPSPSSNASYVPTTPSQILDVLIFNFIDTFIYRYTFIKTIHIKTNYWSV